MFRVKTTRRNVKRAISPLRPATDGAAPQQDVPTNVLTTAVPVAPAAPPAEPSAFGKSLNDFFDAESASVLLTKPWLRLERGLRLQKLRAYADSYPGLSTEEKETLFRSLIKANDARQLNTKAQITYEEGKVQAIRGLKVIRSGDPKEPAVFKIEGLRATKKHSEE